MDQIPRAVRGGVGDWGLLRRKLVQGELCLGFFFPGSIIQGNVICWGNEIGGKVVSQEVIVAMGIW